MIQAWPIFHLGERFQVRKVDWKAAQSALCWRSYASNPDRTQVHSLLHTVQNLIMDNHWRIRQSVVEQVPKLVPSLDADFQTQRGCHQTYQTLVGHRIPLWFVGVSCGFSLFMFVFSFFGS